jgi:hypothetical protein
VGAGEVTADAPFPSVQRHRIIAASNQEGRVDRDLIIALARAAGLDKAVAEFPDDLFAAAQQAFGNAGAITIPTDPADEPWPPMRAGAAL